jgi:hypothetical protein
VPNRWLVTRRLEKNDSTPKEFPIFESWVVQSDVLVRGVAEKDDLNADSDQAKRQRSRLARKVGP